MNRDVTPPGELDALRAENARLRAALRPFAATDPSNVPMQSPGMSLRDWFAGQALANVYTHHDLQPDKVATWAYQIADAMIAARNSHE